MVYLYTNTTLSGGINRFFSSQNRHYLCPTKYLFPLVSKAETICFSHGNTLFPAWKQLVSDMKTNANYACYQVVKQHLHAEYDLPLTTKVYS